MWSPIPGLHIYRNGAWKVYGRGFVKSDHSATFGSAWWLCRFLLLLTLIVTHTTAGQAYVSQKAPDWHGRSTRVAVYIRYSLFLLSASACSERESIDHSHSTRGEWGRWQNGQAAQRSAAIY